MKTGAMVHKMETIAPTRMRIIWTMARSESAVPAGGRQA